MQNIRTAPEIEQKVSGKDGWRWAGYRCENADQTMGRDRMLFKETMKNKERPVLRFYQWLNPTISFGKTQRIDEQTREKALRKGWEIVQRPTGGAKVFHNKDTCFSLIWNKGTAAIPWKIEDSYRIIHQWIRKSLLQLEYPSNLYSQNRETFLTSLKKNKHGWCFLSPVQNDLISDDKKIVGGAQWRDGEYALHQGSIQLHLSQIEIASFKESFEFFFGVEFKS